MTPRETLGLAGGVMTTTGCVLLFCGVPVALCAMFALIGFVLAMTFLD